MSESYVFIIYLWIRLTGGSHCSIPVFSADTKEAVLIMEEEVKEHTEFVAMARVSLEGLSKLGYDVVGRM